VCNNSTCFESIQFCVSMDRMSLAGCAQQAVCANFQVCSFSRQHYQRLNVAKDLVDATDILSDRDFFKEILVRNGA